MKDIYTYLSPFIAAFAASLLTYFFTVRAKKHEFLITERLSAFKAIQQQLIAFQRYYIARLTEINGNDFDIRLENLSEQERKSPLEQVELLDKVLADNSIFLSQTSRDFLDKLKSSLELLCSLELLRASNPTDTSLDESAESQYQVILVSIKDCINAMYTELKLPK